MNRKLMLVFAVMFAVVLPLTLVGQEKKGGGGGKMEKKDAAGTAVTGCLNKGADADHFTFKDEKGKEWTVVGDSATLSKHAGNHNVTLTGSLTKEKDKDVFKVTDVKMNSMCK